MRFSLARSARRALAFVLLGIACGTARAEAVPDAPVDGTLDGNVVKAAFIFNFAKFAEFPRATFASTSEALRICLVGASDELAQASRSLENKQVHGRAIEVRLPAPDAALDRCHVLFVGLAPVADILGRLAPSTLTVGDPPGFVADGGMFGLLVIEGRMHFEANLAALDAAGIRMNGQLLRLAQNIRRD